MIINQIIITKKRSAGVIGAAWLNGLVKTTRVLYLYSLIKLEHVRTDDAAGTGTVATGWTAAVADTVRAREVVPNLVGARLGILLIQF